MRNYWLVIAGFLVVIACVVAYADNQTNVYNKTRTGVIRSFATAADTLSIDGMAACSTVSIVVTGDRDTGNNIRKEIAFSGLFNTAGANCKIGVVRGDLVNDSFKFPPVPSFTEVTLTAKNGSGYKYGTNYVSDDVLVNTEGFGAFLVVFESISAGTVSVGWSLH
jgi:hypothetical protein